MGNKSIIALSIMLVLTGCGSQVRRKMNILDLNNFQIDCNHKYEQIAFLNKMISGHYDNLNNAMRVTSLTGAAIAMYNGTYAEDYAQLKGEQTAAARSKIWYLESCPDPKPKPQGCLHIDESMPSGPSNGAQCITRGNSRPTVNRWEAMVDSQ